MQLENITRIQYVDGVRFRRGVVAAASRLIANSPHLDAINVFPVPDGDTGANMAGTMRSIVRSSGDSLEKSLEKMSALIAESALNGAKGNSGAILAQFLCGFAEGVKDMPRLSPSDFARVASLAARRSCEAISDPKDGTIISVIRDWAAHLSSKSHEYKDFHELLSDSLHYAQKSVKATTEKLAELKSAGVVDAGALGFVYLLEGIVDFLENGKIEKSVTLDLAPLYNVEGVQSKVAVDKLDFRYCTEFLLKGSDIDKKSVRDAISGMGDSLIVAGLPDCVKIHIHTNDPDAVEDIVSGFARVDKRKVDDMLVQHKRLLADACKVGIVTDSTCDIPAELIAEYDIRVAPLRLTIDGQEYIDHVTLTPEDFYKMLPKAEKALTSQPSPGDMKRVYARACADYENVVSLHVAKVLSGTYQNALTVSKDYENVSAFDGKQLTVALGLSVLEAARAAQKGATVAEVTKIARKAIDNVRIFVTLDTLDYAVRGGRVSKGQGLIAKALNIKPILAFEGEGHPRTVAKSFGYKRQEAALIRLVSENFYGKSHLRYAIAHAAAPEVARKFARIIKREFGVNPVFITEASPVLGLHSGPGACAVALLADD
ncbi:DAK2 domain-containing protein [Maridesulfovibrio ferrireducens]|uniref:DAK2 domain-containing protein n=1 Tax=Maridesulfovibrio ferrireducens TaxID=246191 RepID=UPI001A25D97C|nr:DegV family protein [Maridesulfovibrio ferrireducens]MBI9111564.1 DegV family EDD domain-containing protein [Maridesulfovibrio ferrireducens]